MGTRRTVGRCMDIIRAWNPAVAAVIEKDHAKLRDENAKWRLAVRLLESTDRPCEHCVRLESQLTAALRLNSITEKGEAA